MGLGLYTAFGGWPHNVVSTRLTNVSGSIKFNLKFNAGY